MSPRISRSATRTVIHSMRTNSRMVVEEVRVGRLLCKINGRFDCWAGLLLTFKPIRIIFNLNNNEWEATEQPITITNGIIENGKTREICIRPFFCADLKLPTTSTTTLSVDSVISLINDVLRWWYGQAGPHSPWAINEVEKYIIH